MAFIAFEKLFSFSCVFTMQADIQNVKDTICSAVYVMQAMASSICSLLTKVILLIFEFSSLPIGVSILQIGSILVLFT